MNQNIEKWLNEVKTFEGALTAKGYKYLGWQVDSSNNADFKAHYELHPHTESNKSFSQRGTHETYWCDSCKIWWNIDMGD